MKTEENKENKETKKQKTKTESLMMKNLVV